MAALGAPEEPKDVTANELKELERVFDFLCDFAPKNKLNNLLKPKLERKQKILSYQKNPEAVKLVDDTGRELSDDLIDAELQRLEEEISDIEGQINTIKSKPDKKIKPKDLQEALAFLGKRSSKVRGEVSMQHRRPAI